MSIVQEALLRLLKPLVRILLRQNVTFDEFAEVAKRVYVDVANDEFTLEGRKQTIARVAMLTGIQRKEVSRLTKMTTEAEALTGAYNRGARVTSGWRRDPEFSNDAGEARSLPIEGPGSFAELVKRYSGDLPHRAVLDELQRVGVISVADEQVSLVNQAGYIPSASLDEQVHIVGQATADLLETLSYNTDPEHLDTHMQLTVSYDNLSTATVSEFKKLSQTDSFELLKQFDEWLSARDRDNNPDIAVVDDEPGIRAGIGIYFFQSPTTKGEST